MTSVDAAREAARNTTNGQFGEQHLTDPGDTVLAGPGPITGQGALGCLARFDVAVPDGVAATVYEQPVPGLNDPEFYDSTIAVFEGPAGRIEVYREGDAALHLAGGVTLRKPEEFRHHFPAGNIPRDSDDGFDETGHEWRSNAWFIVRPADSDIDDLNPDDVEYNLDTALRFGAQLAARPDEWSPQW